jgi:hypothetical protein
VPADWQQPDVPEDQTDFSNPTAMKGLSVFVSNNPTVPILLTISGRPGYEDGAVMQWGMYIVQNQGLAIKTCMPVRLEAHEAIEITCTQEADPEIGEMTIKGVFLEDGGNFFIVTTMAPTKLFAEFEPDFAKMRHSFRLLQAQGSTKPLVEGGPVPKTASGAVTLPSTGAGPAAPKAPTVDPAGPDLTPYVLNDPAALDSEDEINKRFRDNGAGLVPNVQHVNHQRGYAVIGSSALEALFAIPLGWHAVDDGRRTLLFDKDNVAQVNLNPMAIDGQSPDQIFTAILQDLAKESPDVEHRVLDLEGNPGLAIRNLVIDGQQLQQCYILMRHPHNDNVAIKVRVTSDEENIARALNMTGEIVKYIQFLQGP